MTVESLVTPRKVHLLYLKTIDIAGFKSFARPAHLELPPGITALVGPNGSGKSNIVDALRWCLGEQSMRDLRGTRAEDVIHVGSRRSLGSAEVSLMFEASPSDPSNLPASMSVARRLYRSGDSEYLVDGRRVRLRDVQDALRMIDIDGSRHIVVNQGMADALLSAGPADRRALLEQAAGLGGYRTRRDEARQKLQTTADNVATMEIVLAELEPRLRMLRRQARVVRDRDAARDRLTEALRAWYGHHARAAEQRLVESESRFERCAEEREQAEAALRVTENLFEQASNAQRAWQQKRDALDAAQRMTRRELDSARDEMRAVEARLREAEHDERAHHERISRLREYMASTASALEMAQRELVDADGTVERLDREMAEAAVAARSSAEKLADLEKRVADQRRIRNELEATRLRAARSLDEADHQVEYLRARRLENAARLDELERAEAAWEQEIDLRSHEHDLLADSLKKDLLVHEQRLAHAAGLEARARRLVALNGRVRVRLAQVEREIDRERKTAATLGEAVGGSVLERLHVPSRWTTAIAAALGTWVAAGTQSHRPGPWTPEERDAWCTWRAQLTASVEIPAVWADTVVAGLDSDFPSPLHAALLVTDGAELDNVWAIVRRARAVPAAAPSIQVVSMQGTVRSSLGWETARQDDRAARFLRLTAAVDRMERRKCVLAHRLDLLRSASEAADRSSTEARDLAEQAEREVTNSRESLAACDVALSRARRENDAIAQERGRLQESTGALDSQCAAAEDRAREARESIETLDCAAADALTLSAEVEPLLSAAHRENGRQQERAEALGREREAAASRRSDLHGRLESTQAAIAASETEIHKRAAHLPDATALVLEERRRLGGLAARVVALNNSYEEGEGHLAELRAEEPGLPAPGLLAEPGQRLNRAVGALERATAARQTALDERDTLILQCRTDLGLEPFAVPAPAPDAVPTEDEIKRLKQRANQYAEADQSVVIECDELEQRYERLTLHVDDLRRASSDLRCVIEGADVEMQTRFSSAFADVNREFGRVFEMMLRGGSATLEVSEPDGGILVQAQLPGKRSRSSTAFSGGERALVATSLLFGVLRIRPTPFCVLDEVDAALDESNVDRYLSALRDISRRTQIVVVTHNRATMAAADVLYGLTMNGEGGSSLLSLRLEQYEAAG